MPVRPAPSSGRDPRRGRPAAAPPPRAGAAVAGVLAKHHKRFGPGFSEIVARWPDIAGARLAKMCRPEKLVGRGDKGVLHIAAKGPAAVMVEAESPRIVERVNTYCGRPVIGRIRVRQSALAAPATSDRTGISGRGARLTGERPGKSEPRPLKTGLAPSRSAELDASLAHVDDPRLKAALARLGRAVMARGRRRRIGEA